MVDQSNSDNYHAMVPTGSQTMHQLRAPVSDCGGRAAEIDQIVQAIRASIDTGVTAAISGVDGVGKTELAYAVARQLAPDFPDAHVLIDLRGASAGPISPTEALQQVIRTFVPEAKLPDDPDELQHVYRSLLTGRRVLVLADDAKDAAQVRPLLPPPGCALLVTSPDRLGLPELTALDLSKLPPADAEQLVRKICPRIGDAAPQLVSLCSGLPLALRMSASLLASDPTLMVERYLARLADERTRLQHLRDPDDPSLDIDAALQVSYAALDATAQQVLGQLGVFVASFDAAAARAVVVLPDGAATPDHPVDEEWWSHRMPWFGRDSDPAKRSNHATLGAVLLQLYRHGLLEYAPALERTSLHSLVRAFALARLIETGDEGKVRLRYAWHYAQVAHRAQTLYNQGGEAILQGLALFDQERAHIDAGWGWARAYVSDPAVDSLLVAYADATTYIGELRYDVRRVCIPQFEAALVAAQRLGDKHAEGRCLSALGNVYADLSEMQRAIDYYELWLTIARAMGDRRSEGTALGTLGNAYFSLGEVRRAMDYYEQWLTIAHATGDRRSEGTALGNLGSAYYKLGEVQRAIDYYQRDLSIARAMGERRGEGTVVSNLAAAYRQLGQPQRAIEYYEQRLSIARELGDRRAEAIASWNMADLLEQQGDLARAVELMQMCVDYEQAIGHPDAAQDAAYLAQVRQRMAGE